MELEGIRLPSGPPAIIDDLDQHAPSAMAPPPLDLLHMALMFHLPNKVVWHRGARHNSSTRNDGPDAINYLHKM